MQNQRRAMTLIELLVVVGIIGVFVGLLLPAVQKVRESAARVVCMNNLKQIGIGLHHYHDQYRAFPSGLRSNQLREHYPYLSWHARILPFIEKDNVWKRTRAAFKKNRDPFKSPPHDVSRMVIPLFVCPTDERVQSPQFHPIASRFVAFTSYLGSSGLNLGTRDGVFFPDSRVSINAIRDGTSQTLMVGERPPSHLDYGWWYAGTGQRWTGSADMVLGAREFNLAGGEFRDCPRGPYHFSPGDSDNPCSQFHYWSFHSGGAQFLLADGSVRFLTFASDSVLPALATRAGSEDVITP